VLTTDSKILISGLVRNAKLTLRADIKILFRAFEGFSDVRILLIESDSDDGTAELLQSLSHEQDNLSFISLGRLDQIIPIREDRISFCRNRYLEELRNNPIYSDIDYLAVADMDGINSDLTNESIKSCFNRSDWDACFANQYKYYYDIYALRHEEWSPDNCWRYETQLRESGVPHVIARERAVYSRQRKIHSTSDWIEVDSAFGGFGLYDRRILQDTEYKSRDHQNFVTCEHVTFHEELRRNGARLYINPGLINSRQNSHTSNRLFFNRLKWLTKVLLVKLSPRFALKSI